MWRSLNRCLQPDSTQRRAPAWSPWQLTSLLRQPGEACNAQGQEDGGGGGIEMRQDKINNVLLVTTMGKFAIFKILGIRK